MKNKLNNFFGILAILISIFILCGSSGIGDQGIGTIQGKLSSENYFGANSNDGIGYLAGAAEGTDESYFPQRNIKEIFASSTLESRYKIENIIDATWESWSEGSGGNGVGESFTVIFKIPVKLSKFIFKNGYGQLDYYYKNNRVKSFEVLIDDAVEGMIIDIEDTYEFQWYNFPGLVYVRDYIECEQITFIIREIYEGTSYNDTCIDEIWFGGPEYRQGGIIMNYPDIWYRHVPDRYTVRLLQTMYNGRNIQFRINKNGRPELLGEDWEAGGLVWGELRVPSFLHTPSHKIFLSPYSEPILLRVQDYFIDDVFHYQKLHEIRIFENNSWRPHNNEKEILPIINLINETSAQNLFCGFEMEPEQRTSKYEVGINVLKDSGKEPRFGPRHSFYQYDIVNMYTLFWNGTIFEISERK